MHFYDEILLNRLAFAKNPFTLTLSPVVISSSFLLHDDE
jgi:hypothetical protein